MSGTREGMRMEALLVKLGVLAGLFGYIGLLGLALLLASVIWLMIRVANFDSVLPGLLCVLVSVALVAGGLLLTPAPKSVEMEPLRPPWEAPLEALKEQTGKLRERVSKLKDIGPWARFFKDEEPEAPEEDGAQEPEGEEPPEMERMEVVRTSLPETEEVPTEETGSRSPSGRNQPGKNPAEDGGEEPVSTEPVSAEQSRVLIDEVLDGWRIRLTLPQEWKELCVAENRGYGWLDFSQKVSMQKEGGWLFSLSVVESPYDFDAPDALPACEAVLEKDGMTLLAIYPTDVQFNYEVEEIAEEYQRMQEAIPGILKTVEFERA